MRQRFEQGVWSRYTEDGRLLGSRRKPYACPVDGARDGRYVQRFIRGGYVRVDVATGEIVGRRRKPYACPFEREPSDDPINHGYEQRAKREWSRLYTYDPNVGGSGAISDTFLADFRAGLLTGRTLWVQVGIIVEGKISDDREGRYDFEQFLPGSGWTSSIFGKQRKGLASVGIGIIRAIGPGGILDRVAASAGEVDIESAMVGISCVLVSGDYTPTPTY